MGLKGGCFIRGFAERDEHQVTQGTEGDRPTPPKRCHKEKRDWTTIQAVFQQRSRCKGGGKDFARKAGQREGNEGKGRCRNGRLKGGAKKEKYRWDKGGWDERNGLDMAKSIIHCF